MQLIVSAFTQRSEHSTHRGDDTGTSHIDREFGETVVQQSQIQAVQHKQHKLTTKESNDEM